MCKIKEIKRPELTVSFYLKREKRTFNLVNLPPYMRIKFTGKECGEVNCFYFRNPAIIKCYKEHKHFKNPLVYQTVR